MIEDACSYGCVTETAPIFISGVYRSGTTLLSAILGAHPKIFAASSTVKFLRFCLGRYGDVSDYSNALRLLEDTNARVQCRWGLAIDIKKIIKKAEGNSEISYALLYDLIMRDMLGGWEREGFRWAEKLAVQWADIPIFLQMFPNGKAIHIFRDPRDTTASYKHMTFESGNSFLDAAFNFRGAAESIESFVRSNPERVLSVKVEDISDDVERFARGVCNFLALDYDKSMTDPKALRSEGEDWASNTSFGEVFEQIPKLKPRWPDKLTRCEVMFIELITQPYLSKCGYDFSGFFPSREDWISFYDFIEEPFLKERFLHYLTTGKGTQGYKTDPYHHEMKIVFPERYN